MTEYRPRCPHWRGWAPQVPHPSSDLKPRFLTMSAGLHGVLGHMVSSRGGKYGFVYKSRQNVYRALRRKGKSKSVAARIANGGHTHLQRVAMARKGAAHRRARGR